MSGGAGPGPICARCHDDYWQLSGRGWTYATDRERGRLLELWGGSVQAMIDVRTKVRDAALRELLIAELEREGYTVTPPPPYPGPFIP